MFLLYVPSVFELVVSFGDYQISPYFFVLRLMQAGALSGVFHKGSGLVPASVDLKTLWDTSSLFAFFLLVLVLSQSSIFVNNIYRVC